MLMAREVNVTNPTKVSPRDIAVWEDTRMLSTVVDSGPYEQNPVPGTNRKLVSLWLYWTPNEPERDEPVQILNRKPDVRLAKHPKSLTAELE